MDEMAKALLNTGVSGVALYVFWKLMSQMLESHKAERQVAQETANATMQNIVKSFREEQAEARENCKEEGQIMVATFERNLDKIRMGWGK